METVVSFSSDNSVEGLSFKEIEHKIGQQPALIIPFGATEPYGTTASMGIASMATQALASGIAGRCSLLKAPLVPVGCSAAFGAFGGTAVLKPATFKNLFIDLLRGWIAQGVRKFVIVNGAGGNYPVIQSVTEQIQKKYQIRSILFDLHRDKTIRAFGDGQFDHLDEPQRAEAAMIAMACFLCRGAVKEGDSNTLYTGKIPTKEYLSWRKRGMDPQKLKKMIPGGLFNPQAPLVYSDTRGEMIFKHVLEYCEQQTAQFLEKE